jgi:hypothetical protein
MRSLKSNLGIKVFAANRGDGWDWEFRIGMEPTRMNPSGRLLPTEQAALIAARLEAMRVIDERSMRAAFPAH